MENTALLTAWAVASITGGLFLLWFIWLQNYYKNLYRNEVKKYCDLKKTTSDELFNIRKKFSIPKNKKIIEFFGPIFDSSEILEQIRTEAEPFLKKYSITNKYLTELGMVKAMLTKIKEYDEALDAEAEARSDLEIKNKNLVKEKMDLKKNLDEWQEAHTNLKNEKTELQAKQNIADKDRKSYMLFVGELRKILSTKPDELPSEIIKIVDTLKKNENKKAGEVDLYYKQEMIKQMESMVGDIFVKSYENALRAYTSKQRKKAFENFFERMQPFFTGKVNAIGINNFNIKNGKNAK